jgi:hypothetical protein
VNADFDSLALGTEVVYLDGLGDSGLRASAVRVVGRDGTADPLTTGTVTGATRR